MGPGKPSKMWGAKPPTHLKAFPAPRGRQTSEMHPPKSGQTASRHPVYEGVRSGPGTLRNCSCQATSNSTTLLHSKTKTETLCSYGGRACTSPCRLHNSVQKPSTNVESKAPRIGGYRCSQTMCLRSQSVSQSDIGQRWLQTATSSRRDRRTRVAPYVTQ